MQIQEEQEILARLSILSPPSGRPDEDGRVRLHLQRTKAGRYRWFHRDGSPTVVAETSVESAIRAANFAWRSWDMRVEKEQNVREA
ncbi:MAG: hypothetical protein ACYTG5_16555 [Planctomycetota bacterium]|jgi:hypothetical protein